jgi:ElaB/YqjD/DUF883 family membrane-anchored ribosome-binding protein
VADEIAAAGTAADWDAELEHSRQAAGRLMDTLARKVGASRAALYVKTHSARDIASDLGRIAEERPIYIVAAAVAAGFLLGCMIKLSLRPRA